jgi:hypothetical protein
MQVRKYGSILFNKKTKDFYTEDGYVIDDMSEANIYKTPDEAHEVIKCLDEPDIFDVWNIEIVYRTVDD